MGTIYWTKGGKKIMSLGKKTGGRDFEKGHKSIGGRPKLTKEVKEFKELTTQKYLEILQKYLNLSLSELEDIYAKQKDLTIVENYVLSSLIKGSKKGDYDTLEKILNRVIGKPKENVKIEGDLEVKNELPEEYLRAIGEALVQAKITDSK